MQGLMVSVVIASLISALASCMNSATTIFTLDLWRTEDSTQESLLWTGRVFTVFFAALSLLWLPMINATNSQLFLYIMHMQVIWCGSLGCLFLAALLPRKYVSTQAAEVVTYFGCGLGVLF